MKPSIAASTIGTIIAARNGEDRRIERLPEKRQFGHAVQPHEFGQIAAGGFQIEIHAEAVRAQPEEQPLTRD